MPIVLARNWWSLVIRGLAGMLLGILSLALPGITLGALVMLFGAYALIDGVMSFIGAWRAAQAHERWGALILEGVVGIIAAVATFLWPAITALSLVYVIAAWAIVTGILEIVAAVRLRRHISGEWLLALAGVASVLFGIALMANPLIGALVLAIWVGVYALLFGAMLIGLGLRLRTWTRRRLTGSAHAVSFP